MASSADTRVCKTTDVDGNAIELRVGVTVFEAKSHVPNAAHFYRGAESSAEVTQQTIIAVSPKGDRIAFKEYGGRPLYEHAYPKQYALSFQQAQAALARDLAHRADSIRAELNRATSLQLAIGFIHESEPRVTLRDSREDPTLDAAPQAEMA